MKIALMGYGKMGKEIEKIALTRNHEIILKIDVDNTHETTPENLSKADVAIDFSVPAGAYENIIACFKAGTPIVCGTTGWLDKFDDVLAACENTGNAFFYASNYSVGVNIFFALNKALANLMNKTQDYEVSMEEIHHIHKLDAPSGTAITLAEGLIGAYKAKNSWKLDEPGKNEVLNIRAVREGEVPGTHSITYESDVDRIHIRHEAKSRRGFALGAVLAAEYLPGKKGYHTMEDLLKLES